MQTWMTDWYHCSEDGQQGISTDWETEGGGDTRLLHGHYQLLPRSGQCVTELLLRGGRV